LATRVLNKECNNMTFFFVIQRHGFGLFSGNTDIKEEQLVGFHLTGKSFVLGRQKASTATAEYPFARYTLVSAASERPKSK
jgi:hypothetical protein